MLNNLKIADKLSLIVLSFALPILILLYLLIQTHQWRINFAEKEITGNNTLQQVRQLQENLAHYHLDLLASPEKTTARQVSAIENALNQLKQSDELHIDSQIQAINKHWQMLKSTRSLDSLSKLETELKTMTTVVGDESNLILDPDLDSYYLMTVTLLEIPKQIDNLMQTLSFAQNTFGTARGLSLAENVKIVVLLGNIESTAQTLTDALELAIKHNGEKYDRQRLIASVLQPARQNSTLKTTTFLKLVREQMAQGNSLTLDYATVKLAGQQAISAQFALWDVAIVELNALLAERIDGLNKIKYLQLVVVILVLILSLILSVTIARAITVPLKNAQKIMAELATGNLELTVEITAHDETGDVLSGIQFVLNSLKNMVFQISHATQKLIHAFNDLKRRSEFILVESYQIQSDTAIIVAESSAMNQIINDNVQELQNTSDKITSLAAAIEQLSTNINTIAFNSENSSRNMGAVTHNIEQVSNNIHTLSASSQQMSAALLTISDSAKETNQISGKANQNAKELLLVMNDLHEGSQRIGKIVKLISNIAEKTNMLSLNATIEAATAGEAGKGFAVVAAEIKDLAQQTLTANNEIEEHISQVQDHIQKALTNTQTVNSVIARVAEINQSVETSLLEEYQCADEVAKSISSLANASKNASLNTGQAEQGLWEISRAVKEAFLASKELASNVEQGNQELQSVTKRSKASLTQLTSVNLHIANIQKSIVSIHDGNQYLSDISKQTAAHVEVLKESVAIFHINEFQD